jgi:hypothetical protein
MNLPDDITKSEITQILHQLWKEYLPNEEDVFIDQLDEEGLRFVFDIIGETDEMKKEEMWNQLEQKIVAIEKEKHILLQNFLQKASKLLLQHRETIAQQQDEKDLEQLEATF